MQKAGDAWKSLFKLTGRGDRSEFLTVTAWVWGGSVATGVLVHLMGVELAAAASALVIAVLIGGAVLSACAGVRRLHDLGLSGWWLIGILALFALAAAMAEPWSSAEVMRLGEILELAFAIAYYVVLACIPGRRGPNRFGDPPGRARQAEVFS